MSYDRLYRLIAEFPELEIVINGGIDTLEAARAHLDVLGRVMISRAVYSNPYILARANIEVFGDDHPIRTREQVVEDHIPYVQKQLHTGIRLGHCTRHMVGLFQGQPGARAWRRHLSENAYRPGADNEVIREALRKRRRACPDLSAQPAVG